MLARELLATVGTLIANVQDVANERPSPDHVILSFRYQDQEYTDTYLVSDLDFQTLEMRRAGAVIQVVLALENDEPVIKSAIVPVSEPPAA